MSETPDTATILDAIAKLDQKFDQKFDELKSVDSHLIEEVQRLSKRQDLLDRDMRDLKSETSRRFDAEREESKNTMLAIQRHVDQSAQVFREKAGDIDELKAMQIKQTEAMGLDRERSSFMTWLTKQDTKDVIRILTLVAAIIGTIIAAVKGAH
jgi:hypothetical protein